MKVSIRATHPGRARQDRRASCSSHTAATINCCLIISCFMSLQSSSSSFCRTSQLRSLAVNLCVFLKYLQAYSLPSSLHSLSPAHDLRPASEALRLWGLWLAALEILLRCILPMLLCKDADWWSILGLTGSIAALSWQIWFWWSDSSLIGKRFQACFPHWTCQKPCGHYLFHTGEIDAAADVPAGCRSRLPWTVDAC